VPQRILVVEDDVMVRNAVVMILTHERYEVLEADSAAEALQVSNSFDGVINLLIAEHSLEAMTGRQLAERMAESRPGLRVLHFFAEARENLEQQGGLIAGAGFLQKPFLSRNLANDVKQILQQPETQKQAFSAD